MLIYRTSMQRVPTFFTQVAAEAASREAAAARKRADSEASTLAELKASTLEKDAKAAGATIPDLDKPEPKKPPPRRKESSGGSRSASRGHLRGGAGGGGGRRRRHGHDWVNKPPLINSGVGKRKLDDKGKKAELKARLVSTRTMNHPPSLSVIGELGPSVNTLVESRLATPSPRRRLCERSTAVCECMSPCVSRARRGQSGNLLRTPLFGGQSEVCFQKPSACGVCMYIYFKRTHICMPVLVCRYASSLGLAARQITPAIDSAFYRPNDTSYQLGPLFIDNRRNRSRRPAPEGGKRILLDNSRVYVHFYSFVVDEAIQPASTFTEPSILIRMSLGIRRLHDLTFW